MGYSGIIIPSLFHFEPKKSWWMQGTMDVGYKNTFLRDLFMWCGKYAQGMGFQGEFKMKVFFQMGSSSEVIWNAAGIFLKFMVKPCVMFNRDGIPMVSP